MDILMRKAKLSDLDTLQIMYKKVVEKMHEQGLDFWDDVYPSQFIEDDIKNNSMYVITIEDKIVGALALSKGDKGSKSVKWSTNEDEYYIDRFAVDIDFNNKGIAKLTLDKIIAILKEEGANYLRLFVVDKNIPATKLYEKYGFKRVEGIFYDPIDDGTFLTEFGYEVKI